MGCREENELRVCRAGEIPAAGFCGRTDFFVIATKFIIWTWDYFHSSLLPSSSLNPEQTDFYAWRFCFCDAPQSTEREILNSNIPVPLGQWIFHFKPGHLFHRVGSALPPNGEKHIPAPGWPGLVSNLCSCRIRNDPLQDRGWCSVIPHQEYSKIPGNRSALVSLTWITHTVCGAPEKPLTRFFTWLLIL